MFLWSISISRQNMKNSVLIFFNKTPFTFDFFRKWYIILIQRLIELIHLSIDLCNITEAFLRSYSFNAAIISFAKMIKISNFSFKCVLPL